MKNLKLVLALGIMVGTSVSLVKAFEQNIKATEKRELSTHEIQQLVIEAGAGSLRVEGKKGIKQIYLSADINVESGNYELSLEREGEVARIIANPNLKNKNYWGVDSPYIHVTVQVPAYLNVKISDGSGDIAISNIAGALELYDGSGDIQGADLSGSVVIKDGSGEIRLKSVGELNINDGSGEMDIVQVNGSVNIIDGSGSLQLIDVNGDVKLNDGSGEIIVKNINGHVTIKDGSGGIEVKSVEKGLTILDAGSGGLSIKDVKGDIETR
ncbi:hypothetical protein [Aliikangiella maris]|uniref:Uncharacterized protein n=2 Tax=Aliikangiella maris TaxID=3162458 RepID=A0ABV2BQE7_9GAMM